MCDALEYISHEIHIKFMRISFLQLDSPENFTVMFSGGNFVSACVAFIFFYLGKGLDLSIEQKLPKDVLC